MHVCQWNLTFYLVPILQSKWLSVRNLYHKIFLFVKDFLLKANKPCRIMMKKKKKKKKMTFKLLKDTRK